MDNQCPSLAQLLQQACWCARKPGWYTSVPGWAFRQALGEVQVDTEQHAPQGLLWNNSVFVRLRLLDEQDVGSRHKESVWPCSLFAMG